MVAPYKIDDLIYYLEILLVAYSIAWRFHIDVKVVFKNLRIVTLGAQHLASLGALRS